MFKKLTVLGRVGLYLLAFSIGVTVGTYIHDHLGEPDLVNKTDVVIKKQKVKGDQNDVNYQNEIDISNETKKIKKKGIWPFRKEVEILENDSIN